MNYKNLFDSNNPNLLEKHPKEKLFVNKHLKNHYYNTIPTEPKSSKNLAMLSNKSEISSPKTFHNNCGFTCKNLKYLNQLSQTVRELISDNEHLRKVNEYLMFHLEKKEDMYMKVSNESLKLKKKISQFRRSENSKIKSQNSSQLISKFTSPMKTPYSKPESLLEQRISKFKEKQVIEPISIEEKSHLNTSEDEKKTIPNRFSSSNNFIQGKNSSGKYLTISSSIFKKSERTSDRKFIRHSHRNLPEHLKTLVSTNVNSHYEKINEFVSRDKKRKYKEKSRVSLLSIKDDNLHQMIKDRVQTELYELTLSDDLFLDKMRGESDDKLLAYSDAIGNLIIEYRNSLKLIKKIKSFLKASVNLVNSVLFEDFATSLIQNACEILNCERTTLFVLDKVSNELVVHSGQGLKKSQVRVSKEQGIVGICFKLGQKVKVDDAYQDIRFNQEVDRLTGYKTKTILCMPLKDENGEIFGVIQSINKKDDKFDEDDEELMEVFSSQASIILKNTMNFDENYLYACRLRMILEFNFDIEKISPIEEFTLNAEHFLMKLFNSNFAQFLVYDEEKDCLLHFKKSKCEEKKKAGIINYVLKSKEFYGCNTIDCKYYNNLADIGTGLSLVTFPILDSENKSVLGVVQMKYNYEFVGGNQLKPKAMAMSIFEFYIKICRAWMERQMIKSYTEERSFQEIEN